MTSDRPRKMSALRRRVATGSVLAALVAALSVAVADPALADTTSSMQNVYYTGICLDSNDNGNVYALTCNGGSWQNWRYAPAGGEHEYQIINTKTGRCLDSNGGGQVYALWCNGGAYQRWVNYTDGRAYPGHEWKNSATGRWLIVNGDKSSVSTVDYTNLVTRWVIPGLETGFLGPNT